MPADTARLDLRAAATSLAASLSDADTSAWRRLLESRLSAAGRERSRDGMRALAQLQRVGGGADVVQAFDGGSGLVVRMRARALPRVVSLYLVADDAHPDSLGMIDFLESHHAAADSLQWPTQRLGSDEEMFRIIRRQMDVLTANGEFSGVVLVTRRGTPVFTYAAGEADRQRHELVTVGSQFHLASIGKMFTATAIGQLVAAGTLHFDDTLATVLPAYPNRDRAARITIRQLLAHTAGLGNLFDDARFSRDSNYASQLALVSTVADAPLAFPPGSSWSYSNEGYEVLAAVIEQVSGERFTAYLQRHVWTPAGMMHTGNWGRSDQVPQRALGYMRAADDPLGLGVPLPNWEYQSRGTGAGGNQSTVADLARFAAALTAGTLLPSAIRDSLWAARTPLRGMGAYGFGAFVRTIDGTTVVGHGGGGSGSGIDNEFRFAADGTWALVVLGNAEPPNGNRIGSELVPVLARQWASSSAPVHRRAPARPRE